MQRAAIEDLADALKDTGIEDLAVKKLCSRSASPCDWVDVKLEADEPKAGEQAPATPLSLFTAWLEEHAQRDDKVGLYEFFQHLEIAQQEAVLAVTMRGSAGLLDALRRSYSASDVSHALKRSRVDWEAFSVAIRHAKGMQIQSSEGEASNHAHVAAAVLGAPSKVLGHLPTLPPSVVAAARLAQGMAGPMSVIGTAVDLQRELTRPLGESEDRVSSSLVAKSAAFGGAAFAVFEAAGSVAGLNVIAGAATAYSGAEKLRRAETDAEVAALAVRVGDAPLFNPLAASPAEAATVPQSKLRTVLALHEVKQQQTSDSGKKQVTCGSLAATAGVLTLTIPPLGISLAAATAGLSGAISLVQWLRPSQRREILVDQVLKLDSLPDEERPKQRQAALHQCGYNSVAQFYEHLLNEVSSFLHEAGVQGTDENARLVLRALHLERGEGRPTATEIKEKLLLE